MTDSAFLQQFESLTLPLEQWNHRAHLRVAYLYLTAHDFESASRMVREGIRAHNAAHGIMDSPTSGYHETQTMAWLHFIAVTLAEYGPAATADEFFDFHPQLSSVKLHRLYYSKALFTSPEARRSFVPPDLGALPVVRFRVQGSGFGVRG
jgi:hypothetical protein